MISINYDELILIFYILMHQSWFLGVVHHVNSVLKKIIIKIFVYMQQKVQSYLLWIQNFLNPYWKLIHVSIFVLPFNNSWRIKTRNVIFSSVSTLPLVPSHNFLRFVINIVNRSIFDFSILKIKCPEHAYGSQTEIVNQVIVVLLLKEKVCLPHCTCINIKDKVVVNYSLLIHSLVLCFVRNSYQTEVVPSSLP